MKIISVRVEGFMGVSWGIRSTLPYSPKNIWLEVIDNCCVNLRRRNRFV